jgi:hypothetical protein
MYLDHVYLILPILWGKAYYELRECISKQKMLYAIRKEREREREITLFFREIILFFLGSAHVNTEKLPSEVPKDSF